MKLNILTKLVGGFAVVILMMVGLGVFGLVEIYALNQHILELGTNVVPSLRTVGEVDSEIQAYRRYQLGHIVTSSFEIKNNFEREMAETEVQIATLLEEYRPLVINAEDQIFLDKVEADWTAYLENSSSFVEASRLLEREKAEALLMGSKQQIEDLGNTVSEWLAFNAKAADEALVQAEAQYVFARNLTVAVLVGAALFAISFGIWLARSIANNVRKMTAAAVGMARGDLQQEIQVTSQDEIGVMAAAFREMIAYFQDTAATARQLANGDLTVTVQPRSEQDTLGLAFDQMIVSLRSLITGVRQSSAEVSQASSELSNASQQSGMATQQIALTIGQVARSSTQQAHSVEHAKNVIEIQSRAIEGIAYSAQQQIKAVEEAEIVLRTQLAATLTQVRQSADHSTEATQQVSHAASKGVSAVMRTTQGMQSIALSTEEMSKRVAEMGQRSQEIGAIVETIEGIAERTNLLALNAAIEAARAGEHGKGFAVVADEVRKLAEQSTRSTREITDLVKAVQMAAGQIVNAMEASRSEVVQQLRQTDETHNSLSQIQASVDQVEKQMHMLNQAVEAMSLGSSTLEMRMKQVIEIVEENTAATEQLAAGSDQIWQMIEEIAAASEENSAAAEEVSSGAEQVTAQVEETVASVEQLSIMAAHLQALIAQFKVNEEKRRTITSPDASTGHRNGHSNGHSQENVRTTSLSTVTAVYSN